MAGSSCRGTPWRAPTGLKVEAQLRRLAAWRDVVGSAKGGEEVVQREFICQVNDRKAEAPLVPVPVEEVVLAHGEVKEAARLDPLRVVVVILGSRCRYLNQIGAELRRGAESRQGCRYGSTYPITGEPSLELLIRS